MIRRLVEISYISQRQQATPDRVAFWLAELRTPELLVEVAERWPEAVAQARSRRPLLGLASLEHLESGALGRALRDEEEAERHADELYWRPLRKRLEDLRHGRGRRS